MPPDRITCVDKCTLVTCTANSSCAKDANGDTRCDCIKSFERLPGSDACIHKCVSWKCGANSTCKMDGYGNPVCECNDGFQLSADKSTCVDTCTVLACGPDGTCVNNNGVRSCKWISPCGTCPPGAFCRTTRATMLVEADVPFCMCPTGYGMTATGCIQGTSDRVLASSVTLFQDRTAKGSASKPYTLRYNYGCNQFPAEVAGNFRTAYEVHNIDGSYGCRSFTTYRTDNCTSAGYVATQCECRRLSHDTLLWHHRLGHPSLPRLRSMHSRFLVSGLPRTLPPLPPSPAPPCIPCVEGRQRAAPHSSSFLPTEAPLHTLHLDVWGPARVRGPGHERYFLLVVDDYTRYTTVFPLQRKGDVPAVLIPWIRANRLQLRERFQTDFPVLRLHSDRGGEFSSDLLAAFCAEHGIRQTFTLPASPEQNGVAERRIGLVMEVARTSMIHVAAPHFLWPFAVRYAAHQLNLWPRVSLPETSPTLLWTGKVGDASRFRVWGARAFVRNTAADKLSPRAIPCVFLGFVPDAPGWQFYDPASRRVFASQDVTFDESVPFYRLFPYRTAPPPPHRSFLPQVDPPAPAPIEVTGDSGPAASGAVPGGAELGGAESGGAERVEPGGAEPTREEPGGAASGGAPSGGAPSGGAEPACAEPGGAECEGESPEGSETAVTRSPWSSRLRSRVPLTSQQLHDWYGRRQRRTSAPLGSTTGGTSAGVAGPGGARTGGTGAAGAGGVAAGGAGGVEGPAVASGTGPAESPGATGGAGAAEGPGAAGGTGAAGAAGGAGATDAGGIAQPRLFFAPPSPSSQPPPDSALRQVLSLPSSTGLPLQPGSLLLAPSLYTEQTVRYICLSICTGAGAGVFAGCPAGAGAAGGTGTCGAAGVGADAGGAGVVPAGSGGAAWQRLYFVPLLEQVLGLPPSSGPTPSFECPPPVQSESQLQLASPLHAPSPYAGPTGGLAERREPESRPASPVCTARTSRRVPRPRPPAVPGTHPMALRPSTAPQRVPLPSPPTSSLSALADPASDSLHTASPTVTRLLATVVTDPSFEFTAASALVTELVDFAAHCRLDFAARLVAESASVCPPSVAGECALSTDVLEDRQEEFQCFAVALPHLVSTLLAPEGDPDAPDIPTPRSYAEAIEDEVPPPGANIVSGMWIFRVKRPPGSPPVFKARYVARGFSQRQGVDYFQTFSPTPKMTTLRVLLHVAAQRDYELHSLDFSTAFLQGSLHEEIWLRRPPGFTGSFPPRTQWSLRRPVYGLRQAPREWHDTLRTTLAALGFSPSTADPSLFLCTDTSLPPFYILVYVDDLVFATADTAGLAHVKSELQKRHTCTDLGELRSYLGLQITRDRAQRTITLTQSHMVQQVLQRFDFTYSSPQATPLSTRHSLSALPSDESVEPSGPYPELVGCLMYLMTSTRPDLAYPLSILARYVAPGRHRPEHMAAAKRVLRYLCSTSGLGLVLGGRSPVVLTGHADASWVDDLATQRSSQGYTFSLGCGSVSWRSTRSSSVLSSSCEAEIYAGAMAAQELRWLTYLLTGLGEPPSSPPVLYVDNKAMLALCREHGLEHRTKHIALRYFLARELQQRGQLRLAYVASQANTADIFTKALQPCDHQRFCTMLACFALLCLTGLRREPASRPVSPVRSGRSGRRVPSQRQPTVSDPHLVVRRPSSPSSRVPMLPPPASSLPVVADPASDLFRAEHSTVPRLLATVVTDPSFESAAASALVAELVDFAAHCRLDYAASLVAESESVCPPSVGGECALGTDVLEDRQEDLECLAAAAPHLVSMLLAPEGDQDAPDIPTLRSYAEAIAGEYSSQWQTAMDAEMASWKSTGTYVDEVPPPGANIVSGMWIFRVKRPPGSPPVFKARYVARDFSQREGVDFFQTFSPTLKMTTLRVLLHVAALRDYELHSLDFSTAFLPGSLHEEIWLRRPPGFTGSFPPSTQWSLRRPVYGLRQAPREWHDTLRTTLAALGFAPSTADLSLFLRTDTSLPPFYILVYVDDLVFATAHTEALALVKSELQKRHTCTDLGELHSYLGLQITRDRAHRTITLTQSHMVQQVLQRFGFTWSSAQPTPLAIGHSLSAPPSDESVEPSGPYPELVGCLMYLMTCTRPGLAYPLGLLARYVAPGRHRKVHMDAAKRVLRYLCSTSGMGLVLGGRGDVVLTGHSDASWVDDQATQRSSQGYTFSLGSGSVSWRSTRSSSVLGSSCEAEIYATVCQTYVYVSPLYLSPR
ncbi:unnamed protein product [Closterium sp. NIES-53]